MQTKSVTTTNLFLNNSVTATRCFWINPLRQLYLSEWARYGNYASRTKPLVVCVCFLMLCFFSMLRGSGMRFWHFKSHSLFGRGIKIWDPKTGPIRASRGQRLRWGRLQFFQCLGPKIAGGAVAVCLLRSETIGGILREKKRGQKGHMKT